MSEMNLKTNICIKVLPFCHGSLNSGGEIMKETVTKEPPVYGEPKTTNPQIIEITFGDNIYSIPKSTNGFL